MADVYNMYALRKLVRDSSLENMGDKGAEIDWHTLDDEGFARALALKLLEEADELVNAKTMAERREEMADVLEILIAMAEVSGISMAELESIRQEKISRRGNFSKRIYVESITCPAGSYWDEYCGKTQEKYPLLGSKTQVKAG